jgi:hypothetical protein
MNIALGIPRRQLDSRMHLRQRLQQWSASRWVFRSELAGNSTSVKSLILAQQQEFQAPRRKNNVMRGPLTALATEATSLP